MARRQLVAEGDCFQTLRVAANTLNTVMNDGQPTKGGPPSLWLGCRLTTHRKNSMS
jgi:hypothetical protein